MQTDGTKIYKQAADLENISELDQFKNLCRTDSVVLLNLNHNIIRSLDGISRFGSLIELHLSGNCIKSMKGVEFLSYLQILDLSCNQISKISGLSKLESLTYLDLSNNVLTNIDGLRDLWTHCLFRLSIDGNPCFAIDMTVDVFEQLISNFVGLVNLSELEIDVHVPRYLVLKVCKSIKRLNGDFVSNAEKEACKKTIPKAIHRTEPISETKLADVYYNEIHSLQEKIGSLKKEMDEMTFRNDESLKKQTAEMTLRNESQVAEISDLKMHLKTKSELSDTQKSEIQELKQQVVENTELVATQARELFDLRVELSANLQSIDAQKTYIAELRTQLVVQTKLFDIQSTDNIVLKDELKNKSTLLDFQVNEFEKMKLRESDCSQKICELESDKTRSDMESKKSLETFKLCQHHWEEQIQVLEMQLLRVTNELNSTSIENQNLQNVIVVNANEISDLKQKYDYAHRVDAESRKEISKLKEEKRKVCEEIFLIQNEKNAIADEKVYSIRKYDKAIQKASLLIAQGQQWEKEFNRISVSLADSERLNKQISFDVELLKGQLLEAETKLSLKETIVTDLYEQLTEIRQYEGERDELLAEKEKFKADFLEKENALKFVSTEVECIKKSFLEKNDLVKHEMGMQLKEAANMLIILEKKYFEEIEKRKFEEDKVNKMEKRFAGNITKIHSLIDLAHLDI